MLSELNWRPAESAKTIRSKPNATATHWSIRPIDFSARKRRPGQTDADTQHVPLRLQLDDVDIDVAATKRDGKRQARDAAADDEDLLDAAHGKPTAITPASTSPP